jgi:hypothetical protein
MKNKKMYSPLQKAIAIAMLLMVVSISAFATPTALSTQVLVLNNAQVSAGGLLLTLTACDNTNGNTITSTGREVLLVQNTDSSTHTITITPVADPYGGLNTTLTAYSLAATSFSAVQLKYQIGWVSGTTISLTCNSNLVKYAVLQYN